MHILLDEQCASQTAETIGDAISIGSAAAAESGRCLVEVHVDGHRLSDSELAQPQTLERRADEVKLITAEPATVVREALEHAAEALDGIDRLQQDAGEFLQIDDLPQGFAALKDAIEAWTAVQQAVAQGAALAGIDLERIDVDGTSANEAISELNSRLSDMVNALRAGDTVALADALLYEMPDTIVAWRSLLLQAVQHFDD